MRLALAALAAASTLALVRSCGAASSPAHDPAPAPPAPAAVEPAGAGEAATDAGGSVALFARDVRPVLERRCSPCHFAGGKMHDELPFDDPATVHRLGERLFSRIREPGEVEALRRFFAAQASGS